MLNALIIGFFLLLAILRCLNPIRIYNKITKVAFSLPFVSGKIKSQLDKAKEEALAAYPAKHRSQLKKIEYKVVNPDFGNECEVESTKGHLSGSRYPDKKHSDFVIGLSK